MNIETIKNLVLQGESETLEFKKSTARLHAAFETICAFLNGQGGTVLIGVTDTGQIVGQEISDATKLEIAKEIGKIEPAPKISIDYIDTEKNRKIIVINANQGEHPPYAYDHRPYRRTQSSTEKMSQHHYEQMIIERGHLNHDWESFFSNASIDDLDHDEIRKTVRKAVEVNRLDSSALDDSLTEILNKLGLLEDQRLNNAAMVLFAKSVKSNYPQCMIKMARFKGSNKLGDFIDSQILSGNAFEIMRAANSFIMRHLPVASFFHDDDMKRIDKPFVPIFAIREALCNAICHRDYSVHNAALTLAIFDDRLEIWNNGVLLAPLTIDDLRKTHQSYPRNKKMAKVFYLRKYVETWGTGTTKMIDLCRENDVPEPIFSEYSGGFSVTFKYKSPIGISPTTDDTINLSVQKRKESILSVLTDTPLSANDIHKKIGTTASLRSIKRDLSELQQEGAVKQIGKGKNILWSTYKD